jgi:hypothetical protein
LSRAEFSALLFLLIVIDMTIEAIAAAIYNHIVNAQAGANANPKISMEQLMDEVVAERDQILKDYLVSGAVSVNDLSLSLNCVEVNCDYMSKCCDLPAGEKALHFEIPPIMHIDGAESIKFIGSIDRQVKYRVYTNDAWRYHKYNKRTKNKPFVYLDTAINSNGNIDGYIFNVPMVKYISVIALFKDPRRLLEWDCCSDGESYLDQGILSNEIIKRLTYKYIQWYKQAPTPVTNNNQQPK